MQLLLNNRQQVAVVDIKRVDYDRQFRASYNNGQPSIGPIIFIRPDPDNPKQFLVPNVGPDACVIQSVANLFTAFSMIQDQVLTLQMKVSVDIC